MNKKELKELEKDFPKVPSNKKFVYRGTGWLARDVNYICYNPKGKSAKVFHEVFDEGKDANGIGHIHYWELIDVSFEEQLKYAKSLIGKKVSCLFGNSLSFIQFIPDEVMVFTKICDEMSTTVIDEFKLNDSLYVIALHGSNGVIVPASGCSIECEYFNINDTDIYVYEDEVVIGEHHLSAVDIDSLHKALKNMQNNSLFC